MTILFVTPAKAGVPLPVLPLQEQRDCPSVISSITRFRGNDAKAAG
jgi:hypothetical protein